MNSQFLEQLASLQRSGASFVTATVVSRQAPVSSHLGDRAIVHESGRMEGFVGGSCSRDIVRRQALEVLALNRPRLVLIRPDISQAQLIHAGSAESVVVPMTCASEGAVDVYLEPHRAAALLLVVGLTPVAEAVARLGALLERQVVRVVTAQERQELAEAEGEVVSLDGLSAYLDDLPASRLSHLAAIVASQGHYDEPALEPLLRAGVGFVGLLSSRKRAVTVRELLELQGLSADQTARIRSPVGLDIGGTSPAEVAVSILAEIIAAGKNKRPSLSSAASDITKASPLPDAAQSMPEPDSAHLPNGFARSPVDGELIEIASAVHFAELDGQTYYFTCANCKRRFLKEPQKFLAASS